MKTTYKIFIYRDGGIKFHDQDSRFDVARDIAFEIDRHYSMTLLIRVPDRTPASVKYAPRCWRVAGSAYKNLEPCSIVDIFKWISPSVTEEE